MEKNKFLTEEIMPQIDKLCEKYNMDVEKFRGLAKANHFVRFSTDENGSRAEFSLWSDFRYDHRDKKQSFDKTLFSRDNKVAGLVRKVHEELIQSEQCFTGWCSGYGYCYRCEYYKYRTEEKYEEVLEEIEIPSSYSHSDQFQTDAILGWATSNFYKAAK